MIVSSDDYLHSRAGAVLAVERHYSIMLRPHWRFVSEQYTFLRISQKSSFLRLLAVLPIAFVSVTVLLIVDYCCEYSNAHFVHVMKVFPELLMVCKLLVCERTMLAEKANFVVWQP